MNSILIIEDNEKLRTLMGNRFSHLGYSVHTAAGLGEAGEIIDKQDIHVIVLDLMLIGENGLEGIPIFLEKDPLLQIIIITGYATIETAVEAMRRGAYDYLQKPVDINILGKTIENAFRFRSLKHENTLLKNRLINSNYCLKSKSKRMRTLIEKARKLSSTELPILLVGESGTGKEVFADLIHSNSSRKHESLIKVNSSAFAEGLLENELFGHEKHSFTGANEQYKGLFEQANGGTLFLDEIGDMSMGIQAKILRALQNREIRRIGGSATIEVDVRLIAATNMDIHVMIQKKQFREDLYYRINTAILKMPSLRERKEDIPLLIEHFLQEQSLFNGQEDSIASEVMEVFYEYEWPGNIRELKNVIQYSTAMAGGEKITLYSLPPFFHDITLSKGERNGSQSIDKYSILSALEETRYNKKKTAEMLGISRKTLYEKLKKYEISY
jgi:DNA-binding NtrC family response regulator